MVDVFWHVKLFPFHVNPVKHVQEKLLLEVPVIVFRIKVQFRTH
jgi:hypothetical protein